MKAATAAGQCILRGGVRRAGEGCRTPRTLFFTQQLLKCKRLQKGRGQQSQESAVPTTASSPSRSSAPSSSSPLAPTSFHGACGVLPRRPTRGGAAPLEATQVELGAGAEGARWLPLLRWQLRARIMRGRRARMPRDLQPRRGAGSRARRGTATLGGERRLPAPGEGGGPALKSLEDL